MKSILTKALTTMSLAGFWVMGLSQPAQADFVWPALYLIQRTDSWWAIGLGFAVEFPIVWRLTRSSLWKSIAIDLVMNLASVLLGTILIPLLGIGWEFFPGSILYRIFDVGTFNPGTWFATFLLAVLVNGVVESLAIERLFRIPIGRRGFWLICLANSLSVGVAFASLFAFPLTM